MCGIFCYIYYKNEKNDEIQWDLIKDNISKRGPDKLSSYSQTLNDQLLGNFAAGVLWMQGPEPKVQPCVDDEGNILLWNGDIFSGPLKIENKSDTSALLTHLKLSKNILETINLIEGPFSLIYYQKSTNLLYFGRDFIGRHSLLVKIVKNKSFMLASTANKNIDNIIELSACGIFIMDCNNSNFDLSCYPWHASHQRCQMILNDLNLPINITVKKSVLSLKLTDNAVEPIPDDLFYFEAGLDTKNVKKAMSKLLKNPEIDERVESLWKLLKKSIEVRIKLKPQYCKNCIKLILANEINFKCNHSKIGILFSGGLDSTILAAIANEYVPDTESIDLINVAFEKKLNSNGEKNKLNAGVSIFDVPDRITGRQAFKELQKLYPSRNWNFIETNVSRKELEDCCENIICHLIYPLKTILDESLGCAVWFASRGSGLLSNQESYESPCRVLLLGMGADELFGGYTRHRTTLRRRGWKALWQELNMELFRISERNLGRDDRVISNHGRQSRLPYLDENVIQYVKSLKPWERCYPTEKIPPGFGDKLLLRLLAFKIGLHETASFPKRAFQFGSRIANSKQNANDISNWLQ
ncbi:asparagine synthetase domain-containing protein 1 isoform X2 [Cotesia typhae]|uniref:asparagine synthetase domain-containing protein 1 isoform X2 n=1 Tax=Cotesia typhae TaxID=2053667 RepID=UPI003D691B60